ncbi:low specificity L-threonine aldolase [Mangrovibacterium marinum]|uniref:L-threonine aldolase n=1 Tax=Mangrovibacterium marinum TaxID=1639118 RepID=A0A2T5BZT4_9BACT|nr:low specificity L-threonine aldolase [Mangrovibacterium marinum]PTN07773.1 L-threonine aldolase [Mangrovibacterium marinum]
MTKRGFASDNNAGIHPAILEAIAKVNEGHAVGYGDDPVTRQAVERFKQEFGDDIEVFFTFNGTGANVLSLASLTQSFNSIICADTAHIQVDECGAPEKLTGCKLITVPNRLGKIHPDDIKAHLHGFGFEHHAQPGVISISQVTELGTIYTVDEIKAIADLAHQHGLFVHLDGARIANAAAALNRPFRSFTRDAGVDVLSFGGTKNGMMMGEAVIFFNAEQATMTKYIRKQSMQLFSKMRFISAQFLAYFDDQLWKKNAEHANRMARLLEQEIAKVEGVTLTQKTQANGVFAIVPPAIIEPLQEQYFFYIWDESRSEVRWMTSFDTTEEDIYGFVNALKSLL